MDVAKVRKDFVILNRPEESVPIYFDSACQTLRPKKVTEAMREYYDEFPACAGRSVHKLATEVSLRCDQARTAVATFFNAEMPTEIAFVKNSTEALNTVLLGFGLKKDDEVVTTDYEHNSVHVPILHLAQAGVHHRVVPSAPDGTFDMDAFESAITRRTKLVAMCMTSNVTGYSLPAKEVVRIAHSHGVKVLFDAAQTAPSQKIDLRSLGVDYLAASGHKMCGPSGIGIFYCRSEISDRLSPLMFGGHGVGDVTLRSFSLLPAPERFETGLQNYAGIIGMQAAVEYLDAIGMGEVRAHEAMLNRRLTKALIDVPGVELVGPFDPNLRGGIFGFNVRGLSPHDVAMILDNSKNIMIRSGMHCCHTYFRSRGMEGCARASLYLYNTAREVDTFVEGVNGLSSRFNRSARSR